MEQPAPAYRGNEPYVFISYSHKDEELVYHEICWLQAQGINVWYDTTGIGLGREWSDEIASAIQGAEWFVYFISPESVASEHCRRELNFAQAEGCSVIAIHLQPTEVSPGLRLSLDNRQAIFKYRLAESDYRSALGETLTSGQPTTSMASTAIKPKPNRRSWMMPGAVAALAATTVLGWLALRDEGTRLTLGPSLPSLDLSVVVVPLVVLGDDARLEDYAAGLTQEMQGMLTEYPELQTLSTPQFASSRDSATYGVKGSVQSLGANMRLRVQLVRTPDAASIWSTTFEMPLGESADELTRVATSISRFIRLELVKDYQCEMVKRKSPNKEAAALVCAAQAQHYAVQQGGSFDAWALVRSARKAVALDPDLPEAYFYLAMGLNLLHGVGLSDLDEVEEETYAALNHGLELAPDNALLLWARGEAEVQFDLNYEAADASFRRALAVDPLHPNARSFHESLAMLAMRRGRVDEALEHYGRSISLYDSDVHVYEGYAYTLLCAGHPREAIQVANQGLDLASTGGFRSMLLATKARAHIRLGEHSQAVAILDSLPATLDIVERSLFLAPMLGVGRSQEALEMVSKLESHPNPFSYAMAMAYAALGEYAQSFEWLHRGIAERLPMTMTYTRVDPAFDEMREYSRWKSIINQLGR